MEFLACNYCGEMAQPLNEDCTNCGYTWEEAERDEPGPWSEWGD